jgi:A/G-specific adenine glycosylase
VDGNVRRVLHRLLDAPRLSANELRAAATELVSADRPGDFNQALMELGALICTPRAPRCSECPLRQQCAAFAQGTQLVRPAPTKAARIPERHYQTLVLIDGANRVLLHKRPANGLLGGLWEFPSTEDSAEEFARKLTGVRVSLTRAETVTHTFSHFRAHYAVHAGKLKAKAKAPRNAALRWVDIAELGAYALPAVMRRLADRVRR